MSAMYEVLRQLDEWRHLPAYQLERRVDIFFGMFLPKVIERRFGVRVDEVIPEFPLHKGELGISDDNRSINVDFAVFSSSEGPKRIFLVELKTDINSLDPRQLENMKRVRKSGKMLCGVKRVARASASQHKCKYAHLIWRLVELECLDLSSDAHFKEFEKMERHEEGPQLKPVFDGLTVNKEWLEASVQMVVILPAEPKNLDERQELHGFNVITFAEFADALEDGGNPMGSAESAFAGRLREWACVESGGVAPRRRYR